MWADSLDPHLTGPWDFSVASPALTPVSHPRQILVVLIGADCKCWRRIYVTQRVSVATQAWLLRRLLETPLAHGSVLRLLGYLSSLTRDSSALRVFVGFSQALSLQAPVSPLAEEGMTSSLYCRKGNGGISSNQ